MLTVSGLYMKETPCGLEFLKTASCCMHSCLMIHPVFALLGSLQSASKGRLFARAMSDISVFPVSTSCGVIYVGKCAVDLLLDAPFCSHPLSRVMRCQSYRRVRRHHSPVGSRRGVPCSGPFYGDATLLSPCQLPALQSCDSPLTRFGPDTSSAQNGFPIFRARFIVIHQAAQPPYRVQPSKGRRPSSPLPTFIECRAGQALFRGQPSDGRQRRRLRRRGRCR